MKRDSLTAELEREQATAKRQQRSQAFTSTIAQSSFERQLATAKAAKIDLEKRLREKDAIIEGLERDRRWLHERAEEEKQAKEQEMAEHEEAKTKYDKELRALRDSYRDLQEEHVDLKEQHEQLSRSTSSTIASQKTRISTLERQVETLESELQEFKRLADERSREVQEAQERMEDLSIANESFSRENLEEENWAVVREELHRQADYMRTLEATNAKLNQEVHALRERYTSVEVLREEKRGIEAKLRALEPLREKVVRLEAEVEAARKEREDWATKNASSSPSQTPVSVTQSLSALRMEHARLLEEHGATVALLHQREKELADSESSLKDQRETIERLQSEVRVLKDIVNRKEQKVTLAEREVGFLQALLASYTAEDAAQEGAKPDETQTQRIQHLEALLADYKSRIAELEKEITEGGGRLQNGPSRKELADALRAVQEEKLQAQKALEEAESANAQLEEKLEHVEQALFELRGEVGGGRHVPPGTRVLALRDNPAQQWADTRQAVLDRLKAENEALLARLKELEEHGVVSGGEGEEKRESFVPRESWEAVSREKEELLAEVRKKEKLYIRLKEVYTKKTAEFREALSSILGIKLAFYPNGSVRVTSQYDLNASFVFQPTSAENGQATMQLVAQGADVPVDIEGMLQFWVLERNCIPGFLASVTLECYDRWERGGGNAAGAQ